MAEKLKVFIIHLSISSIIIISTAGLMVIHFYPGVFADIMDIYDLLKIIIPVDIILGPVLTFFLYKKDKKGLKFDLLTIGLCQIIALIYGCYNTYISRPGFLIFYHDSFYIAPPSIDQKALNNNHELYVGSLSAPKIVQFFLDAPLSEQMQMVSKSLENGIPLQFDSTYFKAFDTIETAKLIKHSISIETLKRNTKDKNILKELQQFEKSNIDYAYIPVIYGTAIKTIAINVDTKKIEKAFDVLPY